MTVYEAVKAVPHEDTCIRAEVPSEQEGHFCICEGRDERIAKGIEAAIYESHFGHEPAEVECVRAFVKAAAL